MGNTHTTGHRSEDGKSQLRPWTILRSFAKIGGIGFGGGMAVISLMEDEFVTKHEWISTEEFLSGVGLSQILGAFPVNAAIFIGYRLMGVYGAILSASAFLAPSVVLVTGLSALYFHYHLIPGPKTALVGIAPAVIALIVSATWSVASRVIRSWVSAAVMVAALAAGVGGISPVWILLAAGFIGLLLRQAPQPSVKLTPPGKKPQPRRYLASLMGIPGMGKLSMVAISFIKVGSVFFGGGFVLVPLLRDHLVTQLGWLSAGEFLDGLAISNLTPGPVAVLATFAGFHVAGVPGALVATLALFLPSVLVMLLISREYGKFRDSAILRRFLSGVQPAVAGLILSTAFVLGRTAIASWHGVLAFGISLILLTRMRWHPAIVLGLGSIAGTLHVLP